MDIDYRIKEFADLVFNEAEKERDEIFAKVESDFYNNVNEYQKKSTYKFERRYEEEVDRIVRENKKELVVAQTELKHELISKRNSQTEHIFNNVIIMLEDFTKTEEYKQLLIKMINQNKKNDFISTVYLVEKDMQFKDEFENTLGVKIVRSKENYFGGMKISISENQLVDCSFKSNLDDEKESFTKIRINF